MFSCGSFRLMQIYTFKKNKMGSCSANCWVEVLFLHSQSILGNCLYTSVTSTSESSRMPGLSTFLAMFFPSQSSAGGLFKLFCTPRIVRVLPVFAVTTCPVLQDISLTPMISIELIHKSIISTLTFIPSTSPASPNAYWKFPPGCSSRTLSYD